ncbi:MAG: hypothetical protein PUC47_05545 [Oscillospiraceae bacterium]|nr:hypothetical protein [Oscillospiraceae bacterium]
MKKLSAFLTLVMLVCLLAACGSTPPPSEPSSSSSSESSSSKVVESSQSTATQTAVLYAVFNGGEVKEYPVAYTGAQITAEELADELTGLTGLDFTITASKGTDGLTVDWAADSTLLAGLGGREQKTDFFFFDSDSLGWFMMDSLWKTLTENLGVEDIYYTMDGGQELVVGTMSPPLNEFPSDTPYMGSEFYEAHSDGQGDMSDVGDIYLRTEGLWRMDGEADAASIEMDGIGGFTMYYASGAVEAAGYLECVDEYGDGSYRYDCYTMDGTLITSFYFDSETQIHLGNDETVYRLDEGTFMQRACLGFWQYPEGMILELGAERWTLYADDGVTVLSDGPVRYEEEAVYLMNDDGSSGGGRASFDDDGNLVESGCILTYLGRDYSDVPKG